jgi:oxygen-independent coproporphyrinogen III oxidase
MAGIYFHIPFCKQACHYCDFHFSTQLDIRNEMIQCMLREITLQKSYLHDEPVQTIYFGGGTPSLLTGAELNSLLNTVRKVFSVDTDAEITLEANPDDINYARIAEMREAGINRLSIGIQSFQDDLLTFLNRAHNAASAKQSIQEARKAGIENISIDLIYSIPGQSNEIWKEDLKKTLELDPEHISAYSLTIEEKTVFGRWAAQGKLISTPEDRAAEHLETLMSTLDAAGYEQYEVSNFSKPGFQSRHNSSYWKQQSYLGIGPSAHSYNKKSRQYNVRNNHQYIRSLQKDTIPFEVEVLTQENKINEYLLTTLRTNWGTDLLRLKHEFQYDLLENHRRFIDTLLERQLVIVEGNYLILTKTGRLLADKITADLFLVT